MVTSTRPRRRKQTPAWFRRYKRMSRQGRIPAEDPPIEEVRRWTVCTWFKFWLVCPKKPCRRARACVGDPTACFERWWRHIPEEHKVQLRATVKARFEGLSPEDAVRAGLAEKERFIELEADFRRRHPEAYRWSDETVAAGDPGPAPTPPARMRTA